MVKKVMTKSKMHKKDARKTKVSEKIVPTTKTKITKKPMINTNMPKKLVMKANINGRVIKLYNMTVVDFSKQYTQPFIKIPSSINFDRTKRPNITCECGLHYCSECLHCCDDYEEIVYEDDPDECSYKYQEMSINDDVICYNNDNDDNSDE
jgi:hypothetical protein